jgi:hypothetical protein
MLEEAGRGRQAAGGKLRAFMPPANRAAASPNDDSRITVTQSAMYRPCLPPYAASFATASSTSVRGMDSSSSQASA